ncbi:MAG: hypothetical protein AAGJ73_12580 [Pseudomonadota bacterium]
MLRSILAVVFGIALGAIAVAFIQRVGHLAYPTAEGIDLKDPEQFRALMKNIPFGAKLFVVASWAAGALAASLGALLVGRRWAPTAWIASGTLFAMAGMTMIEIPHPLWMMLAAPLAFIGAPWLMIRLLKATYRPPAKAGDGLFESGS